VGLSKKLVPVLKTLRRGSRSGRPELRQLVSDLYPFTKNSPREPLCLLLDNEILLRWFSVFQFTRISAGSFAWRSELLEPKDQLLVLSCRSLKGIRNTKRVNRSDLIGQS
jgi:hypothetical protein